MSKLLIASSHKLVQSQLKVKVIARLRSSQSQIVCVLIFIDKREVGLRLKGSGPRSIAVSMQGCYAGDPGLISGQSGNVGQCFCKPQPHPTKV